MNILVVSSSAPPKNSPESLQTGKYLKYISAHHDITLLTTQIIRGWEPEDKSMLAYIDKIKERIELHSLSPRIIYLIRKIYPLAMIPDDNAFFFWNHRQAIRKLKTKPNLIFSRSAPFSSSMMGMKLAKHFSIPWIMHLSDVWSESPFYNWSPLVRKRQSEMERNCLQQASLVTLTSQKTISFYGEKYPEFKSKFKFLPNVFDASDVNTAPPDAFGKLRFVFTGRLYGSRSIHPVIDAFEKAYLLSPDIKDKCEVILAGFFDQENIDYVNNTTVPFVKYIGPLGMNEALRLQQNAHVLVLIDSLHEDPKYQMFFPSKLLDYLAAKRFILAVTGNESTTYEVVEGKCGKCFETSSIQELPLFMITLIDRFFKKDISFFETNQNIEEYSAEYNAERLMNMFEQLIKR